MPLQGSHLKKTAIFQLQCIQCSAKRYIPASMKATITQHSTKQTAVT